VAFATLQELIEHYNQDADGLCVTLTQPAARVDIPQTSTFTHDDQWEIDRRSLRLIRQIGSGQFGEVWEARWNGSMPVAVKKVGTKLRGLLRHVTLLSAKTRHSQCS